MRHIKIIFIILSFTFALDTLKMKSDYFKDFNLGMLNLEAKDILTLQPLKQFAGDYNYITKSQIDSIVNNARLYEPSPISTFLSIRCLRLLDSSLFHLLRTKST